MYCPLRRPSCSGRKCGQNYKTYENKCDFLSYNIVYIIILLLLIMIVVAIDPVLKTWVGQSMIQRNRCLLVLVDIIC